MSHNTRNLECRQCGCVWVWVIKGGNHKPWLCSKCNITHKFCSKCNTSKPSSAWYPSACRDDGKQVYCKACLARPKETYHCGRCYIRFDRTRPNGKVTVHLCDRCEATHKWCMKCDTAKTHASFSPRKDNRTGLSAHCKDCHMAAYHASDKLERVAKKYGITSVEWQRMHDKQNGLCAICGKPPKGGQWDVLYTDHNHHTGELRKLLCANCNKGLGCFGDSAEVLLKAAEYLLSYRKEVIKEVV
jgi:hypothetical protein